MPDFELERYYYPVLEHCAYLDASTTGAIPQYTCDAMQSYLAKRTRNGMDIKAYLEDWDFAERVRSEVGVMINCSPEHVAFGASQASVQSIFFDNIPIEDGDNVVTYETAFPSSIHPWLYRKDEGIETRIAKAEDGAVPAQSLFDLVDERTRAVVVCHVDNMTGYRHDLQAIGEFCRSRDIPFAVDATQSCGALQIDVEEMKIDFLSTSTYKWLLNVHGLGFAYISKKLMNKLGMKNVGWAGVKDHGKVNNLLLNLSPDAQRYEQGGLNFMALRGLSSVIRNYMRLGGFPVEGQVMHLVDYAYQNLKGIKGVSVLGDFPPQHRSGIVMVNVPEAWDLSNAVLAEHGIRANVAGSRIRLGIHFYNNTADIDRFVNFLKKCAAKK